jgi:hypothetical protein
VTELDAEVRPQGDPDAERPKGREPRPGHPAIDPVRRDAMCAALAVDWLREHQRAECWATAAELDLAPDRACADRGYARAARGR